MLRSSQSSRLHSSVAKAIALLACSLLTACATLPYTPQGELYPAETPTTRPDQEQITRGRPNKFVDGLGHYVFSLPSKLVLWNWKVENHDISPETEQAIRMYMQENGLTDVRVRLNEYSPGDEWKRLIRNKSVGAGWRYTVGMVNWLFYTIFPGRVFGGDHYNPFSNTINIYSDLKPVVLHEGGHAKDFGDVKWKGTVALLRILPLYPLRDEAVASNDAVSYIRSKRDFEEEKRAYKVLYPAYGTYIGGEASLFIPGVRFLTLLAAIPGHIVGRIKAAVVEPAEGPPGVVGEPDTAGSEAPPAAGTPVPEVMVTPEPRTPSGAPVLGSGSGK